MQPAVSTRSPRRATQAIRRIAVMLVAILIVAGIASLFVTGRATSELQQSRKRVESLNAEIRQLQKENARLRAEIDSVKKSTFAVERIAREDLGMSRKGEVIYLLPANSEPR
jgi:cell division protein FtsL